MAIISFKQCDELYQLLQLLSCYLDKARAEYPIFFRYISLMEKNLKICIDAEYDGINELAQYLEEDWRSIFREEKSIEKIHFRSSNIDEMACVNAEIQRAIKTIDSALGTQLPDVKFVVGRKWYNISELKNKGENFPKRVWDSNLNKIVADYGVLKSPNSLIDDDIWTYVSFLGLASNEQEMERWFNTEILAYGFLVPIEIIQLENGGNILRDFLLSTGCL